MVQKKMLDRLARLYNVQATYYDIFGRLVEPPAAALLSVLRTLGAPVEKMEDIPAALRQRRQAIWQRIIEPVIVAWNGAPLRLKLRLPQRLAEAAAHYEFALEEDQRRQGRCQNDERIKPLLHSIEGMPFVTRLLTVPEPLPLGYHQLRLTLGDVALETHVFSAPPQAYAARGSDRRRWGLFCPLYALTSGHSWGVGDFCDLAGLLDFAGALGASAVGTLPLFAAFLDEPFDPSPYSPVSRMFWNELYLDIAQVPELRDCPEGQTLVGSGVFQAELASVRAAPVAEYRRIMALKRQVLVQLLRCLMNQCSERRTDFERFIAAHPLGQDYAAFRAKVEREREPWRQWPEPARDGMLRVGDYDEENQRYHLYVQWQAHEQMRALGDKSKAGGSALYLDFPLGVNRDGYDVWRERAVFALDASGGAPPDPFFSKGQNWGFPPLHPEGLRRQGYRHYVHCVRHHLQYAGMLRIDHVMGLHRLYWVPHGFAPHEGVYVRYPAEEFYAVLNIESHRHRAPIVGENLGTVPPRVNAALARHRILGMYVSQFCVTSDPGHALEEVPEHAVASLNTHDTPTFAGYWSGSDIEDRRLLGLLSQAEAEAEQQARTLQRGALIKYLTAQGWLAHEGSDAAAVLKAWLSFLAAGNAELLLVNLEDLWLEPAPQNVPGTWQERPNWKRKARYSLGAICQMEIVTDALKAIDLIRSRGR
jgi:4-alpha-glucanotransferase